MHFYLYLYLTYCEHSHANNFQSPSLSGTKNLVSYREQIACHSAII